MLNVFRNLIKLCEDNKRYTLFDTDKLKIEIDRLYSVTAIRCSYFSNNDITLVRSVISDNSLINYIKIDHNKESTLIVYSLNIDINVPQEVNKLYYFIHKLTKGIHVTS